MKITPELAVSAGLPEDRFPETMEEAEKADHVLAQELEKLSLDEHERVLFDLHGISQVTDEDESMINSKMQELEEELANIPGKDAFLEAAKLDPQYATDYRLLFLRGEQFDVQLAAEKLVQHFEIKREMFGGGKILARDIRQSDLSPKAKQILESGYMQASNTRDSSGRAIMFMTSQYNREGIKAKDVCQAILYYGVTTLKDVETLRNGTVWVFYNLKNISVNKALMEPVYGTQKSLPCRIVALHYCITDESVRPYVTGMQLFFSKEDRFRMRPHLGTVEEIEFQLQTFGVPTEASPLMRDGSWSLTWLHEWLSAQNQKECKDAAIEAASSSTHATVSGQDASTNTAAHDISDHSIAIPRRFDVILGKSAQARVHTGNRRAFHLCDMYFDKYEEAGKFQKTEVAERIVSIVRQSGGRFLKWEEEHGWVEELDEIVARKKIGHFLRYLRSKAIKSAASKVESVTTKEHLGMTNGPTAKTGQPLAKRVTPPSSPILTIQDGDQVDDDQGEPMRTKLLKV